ncbi:MAG: hypothetical protein AAFZ01_01325 [Pseudomonadota bacterium]
MRKDAEPVLPFRWDMSRREQLGQLVPGNPRSALCHDEEFIATAGKIIARTAASRMVFVGRSPESWFDLLSGSFADEADAPLLTLLRYSNRSWGTASLARDHPRALRAMKTYLTSESLAPDAIIAAPAPICFIDLVADGGTFEALCDLLCAWAEEAKQDVAALRAKIAFLGITSRTKNSPNTWRWYQAPSWAEKFSSRQLTSISISPELWDHLGNRQAKVTPSHPYWRWADPVQAQPPRGEKTSQALERAMALYDFGRSRAGRRALAEAITRSREMSAPETRRLVAVLRRKTGN